MKRIPPIAYLIVLLGSLVLAHFAWTEGSREPSGDILILECIDGELKNVTIKEKDRKVVFSQKRSDWTGNMQWWVEASRRPFKRSEKPPAETTEELNVDVASMGPAEEDSQKKDSNQLDREGTVAVEEEWIISESFKGNDKLQEDLGSFCPWKGLRLLGRLGEEKREEFGLKDSDSYLVLELRSKSRKFLLGDIDLGPSDRYIQNEKTGEIFLIPGSRIKNLVYPKSRYMERALHNFKEKDVARVHLHADGGNSDLIHKISEKGVDEGWAEKGSRESSKELYKNWVGKLFSLRPINYVFPEGGSAKAGPPGCVAPTGAETAASVTLFGEKKEIGFLTVYQKTDEEDRTEYFACTEKTDAVVTISKTQAETLLKDMQDLLPQP